jgi:hypothetical protein
MPSHLPTPPRSIAPDRLDLRAGDLVEVRAADEILQSLDERATFEGLPFMPEMVEYCGKRFEVSKRADKVCDTIKWSGCRKLPNSVLLEDLRCTGAGHDGCQAECRLFWKERWLRRVTPGDAPPASGGTEPAIAKLRELSARNAKRNATEGGTQEPLYRCQATELFNATKRLRVFDPTVYIGQYTSGNVALDRFLRVMSRAVVEEPKRKLGLMPEVFLAGTQTKAPPEVPLNLKPGEWVRVKEPAEIAKTLTPGGRNRGLWFDREMLTYCGKTLRVRQRVNRFVDDQNGKMVALKTDAVTLDGATCTGDVSMRRWFCPRLIYLYWRESWLERVPGPSPE